MTGYTGTYAAFVRFADDTPEQRWTGLRKAQAKWRYHWIARRMDLSRAKSWGFEREWQA